MNKNFIVFICLAALLGSSLSVINKRTNTNWPESIPLADEDILEINTNILFNMDQADADSHIEIQQGQDNNFDVVRNVVKGGGGNTAHYRHIDEFTNVGEITNTIFISNSTYLVIHESNDIALFRSNPHSSEIKTVWRHDLHITGSPVKCYDAVAGVGSGFEEYIYLTCIITKTKIVDNEEIVTKTQEIYIFHRKSGEYTKEPVSDDLNEKFTVEHELIIEFFYIKTNDGRGTVKPFLVTYDQGRKKLAEQTNKDFHIRLWSFVGLSPIAIDKETDTKVNVDKDKTIDTLYDVFAWNNQLIISAIISDDLTVVSMHNCKITSSLDVLNCDDTDTTHTAAIDGYIGLGHTHAQVVIYKDSQTKEGLTVYDINQNNFGKDWLDLDSEYKITGITTTEGAYVRDYIGNSNGGVFQFIGTNGGKPIKELVAHSTILKNSFYYPKSSGVFMGRNMIRV